MKINQVTNVKYLNKTTNNEFNNNYYKTKPIEMDSVSFQASPRWLLKKTPNSGFKKLFFGTGMTVNGRIFSLTCI